MRNSTTHNNQQLFGCPVLMLGLTSLAIALLILAPILFFHYSDHISTEATAWAIIGLFSATVFYEYLLLFHCLLLFLIKRGDWTDCNDDNPAVRGGDRSLGYF